MSQRTLISFYQKKQKRDKDRISSLLSGKSKKRSSEAASTEESTAAASTKESTAAISTEESTAGGETEMEDVLIDNGGNQRTSAKKRRRNETGTEEQLSNGNFSKFSKYLIKILYNI